MRGRSQSVHAASGARILAFALLAFAAVGTLLASEAGTQVSPQAPEDAQPSADLIRLTPSAEVMKLDFRDVRTVQTRNITLEASRPLPAALDLAATLNGDLLAEGTESIPMDQVTTTASPSEVDPRIVILNVSVDPEGGETDSGWQKVFGAPGARLEGQFSGLVRVSGDGLEPLSIPLSVTLRSGPSWQAFAMVILGLTVGALFKWNAEVGGKLLLASRKYQRIRRNLFGPRGAVPEGLLREISEIDEALARWDHAEVEPRIEALASKLDKLQEVFAHTARIESIIKRISDPRFFDRSAASTRR